MTKYQLDFSMDMTGIFICTDEGNLRLSNFLVEGQSELLKLGFLPPVVRSISPPLKIYPDDPDDRGYIILVENKPSVANLMVLDGEEGGTASSFSLPVPWQHYFIVIREHEKEYSLSDVGFYFSSTPLASLDHVFYTPYHPAVDIPRTEFDVSNISFFDIYKPEMHDYQFCLLFNTVRDILWDTWCYDKQFMEPAYKFVDTYNFHPKLDFDESEYSRALSALLQIESISFDEILDEKVFKALDPAFTFGDYLKYLTNTADETSFDFKTAFEKAFANRIVLPPKPEIKLRAASKLLTKKNPFTQMESYYIQNPTYTTYNQQVTLASNTTSTWTAAATWWTDVVNVAPATQTLFTPQLYQDIKKRWRRMNGTFASKDEIELKKNPILTVDIT